MLQSRFNCYNWLISVCNSVLCNSDLAWNIDVNVVESLRHTELTIWKWSKQNENIERDMSFYRYHCCYLIKF